MKKYILLLLPCILVAKEPLLCFGAGDNNLTGTHKKWLFQAEYRFSPPVYDLRPQVGIFMTTQLATFIYGGVGYDFILWDRIVITPSFSPGWYIRGNGKNLGFPIEFRSALECAFQFKKGARLGLAISHLSNAHLSHRNPGVNTLVLSIEVPLCFED